MTVVTATTTGRRRRLPTLRDLPDLADRVMPVSAAEARRTGRLVRVGRVGSKGMGVVAAVHIPAGRHVATYPGRVLTRKDYERRFAKGLTTGKYGVTFYDPSEDGRPRTCILDPGTARDRLAPEFRNAVAPLVNEPGCGAEEGPNLMWVWNIPRHRLEFWTFRAVQPGEELTACYGSDSEYPRDYCTACISNRDGVEPELAVIAAPGDRPVAYSTLGPRGVRRAIVAAILSSPDENA